MKINEALLLFLSVNEARGLLQELYTVVNLESHSPQLARLKETLLTKFIVEGEEEHVRDHDTDEATD